MSLSLPADIVVAFHGSEIMSKKKSKGFDAVKPFAEGGERNFISGWIGGRLTTPQAQRLAKERMKQQMRDRVSIFAEARAARMQEEIPAPEEPAPAFCL